VYTTLLTVIWNICMYLLRLRIYPVACSVYAPVRIPAELNLTFGQVSTPGDPTVTQLQIDTLSLWPPLSRCSLSCPWTTCVSPPHSSEDHRSISDTSFSGPHVSLYHLFLRITCGSLPHFSQDHKCLFTTYFSRARVSLHESL
jgi:hypothetical protein